MVLKTSAGNAAVSFSFFFLLRLFLKEEIASFVNQNIPLFLFHTHFYCTLSHWKAKPTKE